MESPSPSQQPWTWFTRDLERSLLRLIQNCQAAGSGIWLYIRGRRQTGKTQTVKHLFRYLPNSRYVLLGDDAELDVFLRDLQLDQPLAHPTLYAVMKQMADMIRSGTIIAIDEVQRASLALQQLLQGVIDSVKGDVLHKRDVKGGLIVLGSKPPGTDEVVGGTGKPLWHRMTEHRTVAEFLPYEMERIFDHFGIQSGKSKLFIMILTGCYPQLLEKLALGGWLKDDVQYHVGEGIKAVLKGTADFVNFLDSEFGDPWCTIARTAVKAAKSPSDVVSELQKQLPSETVSSISAKLAMLDDLYAVIKLERPVVAGLNGKPREAYSIWDLRWYWYSELFERSESTSVKAHNFLLDVSKASVVKFETIAGKLMERLIADAAQLRPRFASDALPAWRFGSDGSRVFFRSSFQSLSAPYFVRGRSVGFDGELDGICIFAEEKIVVYLSCKLSSKRLSDELHPISGRHDCHFRTHAHVSKLKQVLDGLKDSGKDFSTVASIILAPSAEHYLFVTSDLEVSIESASDFSSKMPEELRDRVWFASFNEICSFPSYNCPELSVGPLATVSEPSTVTPPALSPSAQIPTLENRQSSSELVNVLQRLAETQQQLANGQKDMQQLLQRVLSRSGL